MVMVINYVLSPNLHVFQVIANNLAAPVGSTSLGWRTEVSNLVLREQIPVSAQSRNYGRALLGDSQR